MVSVHRVRGVLAAVLCALVAGCSAPASDVSGPAGGASDRPVAVVYRGPASCQGCAESAAALLRRSPLHFVVSFIGPGEGRKLTSDGLRGVDLYAQPGGDDSVEQAMRSLGPQAARAVQDYVAAGGRYVGFCMGAYLAGSDPGMDLLGAGDTGQYSQTPDAEVTDAADAVVAIRWGGSVRHHYAQDPAHIIASNAPGERVLSRFPNGTINALVRPQGRGVVGVVGTHPEAERSWYTDRLWRQDTDGLDRSEGLQLIAEVMEIDPSTNR